MSNTNILKMIAVIVIIIAAVILQLKQNEIPIWLVTAITTALAYMFGYKSDNGNGNKNEPD